VPSQSGGEPLHSKNVGAPTFLLEQKRNAGKEKKK
jgi:hypothetical protein